MKTSVQVSGVWLRYRADTSKIKTVILLLCQLDEMSFLGGGDHVITSVCVFVLNC